MVPGRPDDCKGRPSRKGFTGGRDGCPGSTAGCSPGSGRDIGVRVKITDSTRATPIAKVFEPGQVLLRMDPEEIVHGNRMYRDAGHAAGKRWLELVYPYL
jgi:hypothetical protein